MVLSPCIIICVVGILSIALDEARLPTLRPSPFLTLKDAPNASPCLVFGDQSDGRGQLNPEAWCVPVLYAPSGVPDVETIMSTVATRNGYDAPSAASTADASLSGAPPSCGAQAAASASERERTSACMLGFSTVAALKTWVAANPGRAGLGVVFGDTTEVAQPDGSVTIAEVVTSALPPAHVKYELWFNSTASQFKWYAYDLSAASKHVNLSAVYIHVYIPM